MVELTCFRFGLVNSVIINKPPDENTCLQTKMSAPLKKDSKGTKRKRYTVETSEDADEKKAQKVLKADSFTEVDFKVALRNSNATFSGDSSCKC